MPHITLPTTATVDRPDAYGYGARLDELLLRLAVTPDTPITTVIGSTEGDEARLLRTENTAEDYTSEGGRRFTVSDISGGEGLYYYHRPEATARDRTRFWDSRGIDNRVVIPGQRPGMALAHDTHSIFTADAPTNPCLVTLADGSVLYAVENLVYRVIDITGTPARASEDPAAGTQNILALAVLGTEAYAALGSDLMAKRSAAGTWSIPASAVHTTNLWAVKRRILAVTTTNQNILATIDLTTGAPTTLLTLPTGTTVTSVCDGGNAILAAASDGYIYAFTEDAGTLTLQGQTSMPIEEWPTVIAANLGVVLVGTAQRTEGGGRIGRLYRGTLSQNFTLENQELLRRFPDGPNISLDYSPTFATTSRDAIFVGVREEGVAQVWRYQLASGGLNRDLAFAVEGNFAGLGIVADRLVAGVVDDGLRLESDTFASGGYLITALADFFSAQPKIWVQVTVEAEQTDSGGRAHVSVTTESAAMADPNHAAWRRIGSLYTDAANVVLPIEHLRSRYLALKLELDAPPSTTQSPLISAVTVLGYFENEEVTVTIPVNVSDRVERRNRTPITVRGMGKELFETLVYREKGPAVLEIYRPPLILTGVIERVTHRTPEQGYRSVGALIADLQFRGRVGVTSTATPSGPFSLGIGLLGVPTMGI